MFGRYPSLYLLIFIVPTIALTDRFMLSAWPLFGVAVAAAIVGMVCIRRAHATVGAVCLGLAVGLLAGSNFSVRYISTGPSHISRVVTEPERAHIFGVIGDWPDIKSDQTELVLDLDSLGDMTGRNRPMAGRILVKVSDTSTALQRGDRIEFFGRVYPLNWQSAAGPLDYRHRLHMRGIFATVYLPTLLDVRIDKRYPWGIISLADRVHDAIVEVIKSDLPQATGALAAGFLIGETRGIPVDVYQRFRDSGTLHVLAVSGGNVALVCLFVILILRPLGAFGRTRSLILLIIVILFALICYGEPSVVRASIMATLVIIARMLQRKIDLHNIIALTAVIILLFDPAQLFDIGAQLSFASAWGLILFLPHVASLFESVQHQWWYRYVLFPVLVSLVAQLCSTPLIAYYFGTVPVLSVAANLVIVPLAAVATLGTLAMLTGHLVLPLLGAFIGSLLHPVLSLLLWLVQLFGGEGMPKVDLGQFFRDPWAFTEIVFSYLVIALFAWSLRYRSARRQCVLIAIGLCNVILIGAALGSGHPDNAHCHVSAIPGGVLVVVDAPGRPADIAITGLAQKPYALDERILTPIVKAQTSSETGRLFVLSADYGALDDLIRFATGAGIDSVFVDVRTAGSLREIAARTDLSGPLKIYDFGGDVTARSDAISADHRGVFFAVGSETLLVSRLFPETSDSSLQPTVWVGGRTWRPTPDDIMRCRQTAMKQIVCARIEQALPEDESLRTADLALPEWVIDLSSVSQVTLPLEPQ